jgi:hypothetical protein
VRRRAHAMLHGRSGLPCTSYRAPPSIDSHSRATATSHLSNFRFGGWSTLARTIDVEHIAILGSGTSHDAWPRYMRPCLALPCLQGGDFR